MSASGITGLGQPAWLPCPDSQEQAIWRIWRQRGRDPITERIQQEFFAIVEGKKPNRHHWFTPVPTAQPAAVGAKR